MITIVEKGSAIIYYTVGYLEFEIALDPADPHYMSITQPAAAPHLTLAGKDVPASVRAAMNAWLANAAQLSVVNPALLAALQREQGAQAADDAAWVHMQAQAGAGFARTEATLIDASGKLQSDLVRALTRAHLNFGVTARLERKLQALAAHDGLPKDITAALSRLGLNATAQRGLLQAITSGRPKAPLRFPGFATSCSSTTRDHSLASSLGALATALAQA